MKFVEFLVEAKNKNFWTDKKVNCFMSEQYPILFLRLLFDYLKKIEVTKNLELLDFDSKNRSVLYSTLNQSFLGLANNYWLGNISMKFRSKSKPAIEVLDFIFNYSGLHSISLFLKSDFVVKKNKNINTIILDDRINRVVFSKLLIFFDTKLNDAKIDFINKIFKRYYTLDLDFACMLIQYLELVHVRYLNELNKYIGSVLGGQGSLPELSDNFFAHRPKKFFKVWFEIRSNYPDIFWVIFWSEQIWRAYNVSVFLKSKNFTSAKRMSFRLPYNFIGSYYKRYNSDYFYDLYQFLYEIDYKIKTGSNFESLDLFYCKHFNL